MSVTETRTTDEVNGRSAEAGTAEPEPEPDELSKDDVFHILQNQRRRDALRYLTDAEGKVRMRDLAEQVAAWEHDTTLQALTSDQRQRVYIALYQSHLPTLDDMGVIEYNQSRGVVERTPLADQLDRYLGIADVDADDDDADVSPRRWGPYYLAASGVGALLVVATALELSAFGSLPGFVSGAATVVMFVALSIGQSVDERSSGRR